MKIKLAYGKSGLELNLADNLDITIVEPKYIPGLENQSDSITAALRNPISKKPLKDCISSQDKVAIIFSDLTRATPYPIILPALLEELKDVPDENIIFFNATGTHRFNTKEELNQILGENIVDRFKIIQNDSSDRNSHILVGTTKTGNDIWLHKELVNCDLKILTGFIEPHFFAGFSGGGKAVMPGLALLETILCNHNAKNIDDKKATWGITTGNPIFEEVKEAANFVTSTFLLNITLNRNQKITGVFAGDLQEAHTAGCAFVKETSMVPVKQPFDIVISSNSGFPLDLNLYQSVKGMSAASQVVKQGGSIIIAADCWDGIPDHGEYGKMLDEAQDIDSLLDTIRKPGYLRQDQWQAQIQALVSQKADIYFYSQNLSEQQIHRAHMKYCKNIKKTVDELLIKYGDDAKICILPEGPQTIPYLV
jgi:lactate racemase